MIVPGELVGNELAGLLTRHPMRPFRPGDRFDLESESERERARG